MFEILTTETCYHTSKKYLVRAKQLDGYKLPLLLPFKIQHKIIYHMSQLKNYMVTFSNRTDFEDSAKCTGYMQSKHYISPITYSVSFNTCSVFLYAIFK